PSASHTMGPKRAAELFKQRTPDAAARRVTLYASLAATGRGHLTDVAIQEVFAGEDFSIDWKPRENMPLHPNGMTWEAFDSEGNKTDEWQVYSVGGGALAEEGQDPPPDLYVRRSMREILQWARENNMPLWKFVGEREGAGIWDYLSTCWQAMQEAIERGLEAHGVLPGSLKLKRKAHRHFEQAKGRPGPLQRTGLLTAYALAVSEENASGGTVVTAPTCGACGVLPAVLRYLKEVLSLDDRKILRAMATAGIIGNLVKSNASISGAAVGCQGEVGTACAMAAAAAAQLMGGDPRQIEYAAEMGIEHHLGLTCDPVAGLVQIPCIERNAMGAVKAINAARIARRGQGGQKVSLDKVIRTMRQTGADMKTKYKETSRGGLAINVIEC
ncbi:MAG: L-serine ammonia-lyase, partial [Acidobacteria bacterium]|nr:L-serine ammonia-lyase [Acidobacteriota bacterium]